MSPSSSRRASSHRTLRVSTLVLLGVASLSLTACSSSAPADSKTSTSAPASATTSASESPQTTSSPAETNPQTSATPTNSHLPAEVPKTTADGANISVFKAEITSAEKSKTPPNQMHEIPGEPAVKATVKLTNLSDQPADATYLSFPTLENAGEVSQAVTGEETKTFTEIAPGESQEVTFFFPAQQVPDQATIKLDDGSGSSTSLTHTLK